MMADVADQDFPFFCPADTMRIPKPVRVNLTVGILLIHKRIRGRDPVLAVVAVVACRVNADNATPYHRGGMHQFRIAKLYTGAIPYAYIQKAVILIAGFCEWIECDLLDPVKGMHHVDAKQFPTLPLKWNGRWIACLPFGEHPLQQHLNGVGVAEICRCRTCSLGVGRVKKSVPLEFRMERKAAKAGSKTWRVNKSRPKRRDVHV